jgi:ectoine hydroxylase-related dioxygenase (phytanoyl-CoA dioxygenase family)
MDISPKQGSLLVCPGSHRDKQLNALHEFCADEVDGVSNGTTSGWIAENAADLVPIFPHLRFATASFSPGDICVLHIDVVHMTLPNLTKSLRLSCDTRWLPATEHIPEHLGTTRIID